MIEGKAPSCEVVPFVGGVKNTSYLGSHNWYAAEGYTTSGGTVNDKYKLVTGEKLTEEFFLEALGFAPEIWVTESVKFGVDPYLR